jgi:hypothetical protein
MGRPRGKIGGSNCCADGIAESAYDYSPSHVSNFLNGFGLARLDEHLLANITNNFQHVSPLQ